MKFSKIIVIILTAGFLLGASGNFVQAASEAASADEAGTDQLLQVLSQQVKQKQEGASKNFLAEAPEPASGVPWLKTGISFLFVTSLMLLLAWFVNRQMKGDSGFKSIMSLKNLRLPSLARSPEGGLKVLQNLTLGLKHQVAVLEIEGTRMVVGLSSGQLQLLHVLDPKVVLPRREEVQPLEAAVNPALAALEAAPVEEKKEMGTPQEGAGLLTEKIRQVVRVLKPFPGGEPRQSELSLESAGLPLMAVAEEKGLRKRPVSSRKTGAEKNVEKNMGH